MTGRTVAGVLAVLALSVAPVPATASGFADRLPTDLAEQGQQWTSSLGNLSSADTLDEARQYHARAEALGANLTEYAVDLAPRQGPLVQGYLDSLDTELARGNLSNARSLAGAARNAIADDVQPAFERWDANRTAIGIGTAQSTESGVRVPVVLANPPPGGIGAIDVTIEVASPVRPVEVSIATGQGTSSVDPANRSARIASFDARSLAGFGSGSAPVQTLGHVVVDPGSLTVGDRFAVDLTVNALADSNGQKAPAIALDDEAQRVPEGSSQAWKRWGALGLVGVLGVSAILGARRFLEV